MPISIRLVDFRSWNLKKGPDAYFTSKQRNPFPDQMNRKNYKKNLRKTNIKPKGMEFSRGACKPWAALFLLLDLVQIKFILFKLVD